jgi:hypothetical protein
MNLCNKLIRNNLLKNIDGARLQLWTPSALRLVVPTLQMLRKHRGKIRIRFNIFKKK